MLGAPTVPDAAEALALVHRVEEQARRLGRPDAADRLARERTRAGSPGCTVLVVGEFKKGKSSLLNALLNAPLCPVDADIATAVPTAVRFGADVHAAVRSGTGDPGEGDGAVADVPVDAVDAYARGLHPAGATSGPPVGAVEIAVPRQLLATGLVLVDTPGVGGGLAAAHAARTLRALARADAAIFVSDASQEYTAPEIAFLREVVTQCRSVLCVLTKTDFYPDWRRILDLDTEHLRRAGLELEVVPLSAPLREEGLRAGDADLVRQSGYPQVAEFLRTSALEPTGDLHVRSALVAARDVLTQLLSGVLATRAAGAGDETSAALIARLEQAKQETDRLRGGSARWQQVLGDRIADMVSNVDLDLAQRMRRIRREATDRINAGDPVRLWAELEADVYAKTNEQVLGHYRAIREEADLVVHEVARQYGIAVGDLLQRLRLPDSAALSEVVIGPLETERSSWMERGMLVARGSSGAILIGHAATVVIASLTLVVAAPATAALAGVFARKSLRGVREGELRANRAAAVRAVSAYLEETELVARKDSRDTLRRVSQGLRDHFAERATEMHVAAAQNLEAAAREVQADRDTRGRRLQDLDAAAGQLRALLAEVDDRLPTVDRAGSDRATSGVPA